MSYSPEVTRDAVIYLSFIFFSGPIISALKLASTSSTTHQGVWIMATETFSMIDALYGVNRVYFRNYFKSYDCMALLWSWCFGKILRK